MRTNKNLSRTSSSSCRSLWLCLALLVLCGCSATESETGEQDKRVPIGVQAFIAQSREQLNTRVDIGPITKQGEVMGVFQTNQSGYTPAYDKKYTYQTSTMSWTTPEPIYVDKRGAAKLVAYYDPNNKKPFTDSPTSTVTNANALTAQKFAEDQIWYYDSSQPQLTYTSPNIALQFKPAYARLKVSVTRTAKFPANQGLCKINSVALATSGTNAYTARVFDLATGVPTAGGTLVTAPRIPTSIDRIDVGTTNKDGCDFLLPPQEIAPGGATLYITVDGEERSVLIPQGKFLESKLKSGSQYTISVEIVGGALLAPNAAVTVDDGGWGIIPGSSNGSLEDVL